MRVAPHSINSLYIHLPFCDGRCRYCAFYSILYDASLADRLLRALAVELALWQEQGLGFSLETIYLGGGTPSLLTPLQLQGVGRLLAPHLARDVALEWSVEMNPGSVTPARLAALLEGGVNRFSLGAQSFGEPVLRLLGRRHSVADITRSVAIMRRAGVANLALDLMAGIPGCAPDAWRHSLSAALALNPQHISVYALTAEEGTQLQRAMARGQPAPQSDAEQLAELDLAESLLGAAGYARYEISNYARAGFSCRHHCACWRGGEYIGLGPAAASHVGDLRWTNAADLHAYLEALENQQPPPRSWDPLTPEIKTLERLICGLRMSAGVEAALVADYVPALQSLCGQGLVELDGTHWRLTPRGRQLADYVAVELMVTS